MQRELTSDHKAGTLARQIIDKHHLNAQQLHPQRLSIREKHPVDRQSHEKGYRAPKWLVGAESKGELLLGAHTSDLEKEDGEGQDEHHDDQDD
jgi:hypothetical protein